MYAAMISLYVCLLYPRYFFHFVFKFVEWSSSLVDINGIQTHGNFGLGKRHDQSPVKTISPYGFWTFFYKDSS